MVRGVVGNAVAVCVRRAGRLNKVFGPFRRVREGQLAPFVCEVWGVSSMNDGVQMRIPSFAPFDMEAFDVPLNCAGP